MVSDFLFIIVLYKLKLEDSESFIDITKSLKFLRIPERGTILIYDNSPSAQIINNDIGEFWDFIYIHDSENSGISKAYNIAAQKAKIMDKKWLFFLDQDTRFPINTISNYINAISNNKGINLFAPILYVQNGKITSPYKLGFLRKRTLKKINSGTHNLNKTGPINSGLCVRLDVFVQIGGYNERIKLDGADFQFIERFKKKYLAYYVVDVIGFQNLSNFETNVDKLIVRYNIFLEDVKNFEKFNTFDSFEYFVLVLSRTIKLCINTKKIIFLKIFLRKKFKNCWLGKL